MKSQRFSIIVSALALFSMFFGAGNLVFPLVLGTASGTATSAAFWGLLVTAVLFPLIGLLAMMLYDGNYRSFFGRLGKWPGLLVLFVVQAVMGPFGSIPRLITLSHATLQPYLPGVSLALFSVLAGGLVFLLTVRKQRIIDILGAVLTPLLLLALALIVGIGLFHHPAASESGLGSGQAFWLGLKGGYNTLDLTASFLFATLVLGHFRRQAQDQAADPETARKWIVRHFLKASLIAAGLLALVYSGLCLVSAYYAPELASAGAAPEQLIGVLSHTILGPWGGLVSSVAVAMACLTTAISLTTIFADYTREYLTGGRLSQRNALLLTVGLSALVACLGFGGIAKLLGPVLEVAYPGLIVLSILNIAHKLYSFKPVRVPVLMMFGVAALGYFVY